MQRTAGQWENRGESDYLRRQRHGGPGRVAGMPARSARQRGAQHRPSSGGAEPRLRQLSLPDLRDLSALEPQLAGYDACFFCLGISSAGLSEAEYRAVTYDLTLAAARPLARLNPTMVFLYVSGVGTDSSERGRSMWARVKGATETRCWRCRSTR